MSALRDAAHALAALPDLTGALCTGRGREFDPTPHDGERFDTFYDRLRALRPVCQQCPVKAACRSIAEGTPRTRRQGLWGGEVYLTPDQHTKIADRHRKRAS